MSGPEGTVWRFEGPNSTDRNSKGDPQEEGSTPLAHRFVASTTHSNVDPTSSGAKGVASSRLPGASYPVPIRTKGRALGTWLGAEFDPAAASIKQRFA